MVPRMRRSCKSCVSISFIRLQAPSFPYDSARPLVTITEWFVNMQLDIWRRPGIEWFSESVAWT